MINTGWIIITVLCGIYTISFAGYEIRNKRYSSGMFSVFLILCALLLSVINMLLA